MRDAEAVLAQQDLSRETLAHIQRALVGLAGRQALWSEQVFPPPVPPTLTRFYLIAQSPVSGISLYLNIMHPGERTPIHNHTTWACIAAIAGVETNTLYRQLPAADSALPPRWEESGVRQIGPGESIGLLPQDVHAVSNRGTDMAWHLHLYGRDVKLLTQRRMFDLEQNSSTPMPLIDVDAWHSEEH